jgi:hypothetical protein
VPTTAGDVHLKANAPSPVNEGVVMGTLAELFGDLVPDGTSALCRPAQPAPPPPQETDGGRTS